MARLNASLQQKGILISWVLAFNSLGFLLLLPWHEVLRVSAWLSSTPGPTVIRPYKPSEIGPSYSQRLYCYVAPVLLVAITILLVIVLIFRNIFLQSEAHRLAGRSSFLSQWLRSRQRRAERLSQQQREAPTKAWNAKVLALGKEVAADLVQEIAEWSVLYTKKLLKSQ